MFELAKTVLAPGTLRFGLLAGAIGIILLFGGGMKRRVGMTILAIVGVGYCLFSMPFVAAQIAAGLSCDDQVRATADAKAATAVVVLSGDSEDGRIRETLRVNRLFHPSWIVVAGPWGMATDLISGGIPRDRIVLEPRGRTTRQQALNVKAMLPFHDIERIVLVASQIHMRRALSTFRSVGIDAVPSASAVWPISNLPRLSPSRNALRLSRESFYEYLATGYYKWRGWLGP